MNKKTLELSNNKNINANSFDERINTLKNKAKLLKSKGYITEHTILILEAEEGLKSSEKTIIEKYLDSILSYIINGTDGFPRVNAGILAEHIKNTHVIYVTGDFYLYKNGYYKKLKKDGSDNIEKYISEFIPVACRNSNTISNVKNLLKASVMMSTEDVNKEELMLNLSNGIYDVGKNRLLPHKYSALSTVRINCSYNPDAKCPMWLTFISKGTSSDEDKMVLQELLGLLLTTKIVKKLFVLLGPTGTGKSQFLNMIQLLIGQDNISNEPLQKLATEKFSVARLYGKTINICGELDNKAITSANVIKMLTGGDYVAGEIKGIQETVNFKNKAKLIFSANEVPSNYAEQTDALYKRFMIIPFKNKVKENEIIVDFAEKVFKEEADGILNWALEGLKRLMRNKFKFTESQTIAQELNEYMKKSNAVLAWVEENFEKVNDGVAIEVKEMYELYKITMARKGKKAVDGDVFIRELEKMDIKVIKESIKLYVGEGGYGRVSKRNIILGYRLNELAKEELLMEGDILSIKYYYRNKAALKEYHPNSLDLK